MRFYIQTFGCQMNENDSAIIASLLRSSGHIQAGGIEDAELVVVNTCCVRQSAENKAFGYIGSFKGLKEKNPALIIAVCGCMIQKEGVAADFLRRARHVSILCGTFAIARLPEYIAEYRSRGETIVDVVENYDGMTAQSLTAQPKAGDYKAQVNIIYGCDNFCAYCIVPYVRGRERSRAPQLIIEEARNLAQAGIKEVQLLGQNVNSYGKNLAADELYAESWNFARLLRELDAIDGLQRIRYMTSHPRDFNPELAEVIASSQHICHHFHLPLQAGCDKILAAMNRGYNTAYYERLLQDIRQAVPDATITSDLIVGFPGESEEDFQQTLDFVSRCQFDAAYTFLYSERSGTPAASMPGQVPSAVKKDRLQRLMDMQNPISLYLNQQLIGQRQAVLVEGPSKNNSSYWSGRTDGNKIVTFVYPPDSCLKPGDFAQVKIHAAQTWNLSGVVIS